MEQTRLQIKTLSPLLFMIFAPGFVFAGMPAAPDLFPLNRPGAMRALPSSYSQAPVSPPAQYGANLEEPGTDSDFDEDGEEQDDDAEKRPVRLDGDGKVTIYNSKTRETLSVQYRDEAGNYLPAAAQRVKHFFRCRLTDEEHDIAPGLLEILDSLQQKFGDNRPISLLSGYRSPELNAALRHRSSSVAKKSLHMSGMAADIRIPGVPLTALKNAAYALQALNTGGVGYYPSNGFVHIDTGSVRTWSGKARVIKHKRKKHGHSAQSGRTHHK